MLGVELVAVRLAGTEHEIVLGYPIARAPPSTGQTGQRDFHCIAHLCRLADFGRIPAGEVKDYDRQLLAQL